MTDAFQTDAFQTDALQIDGAPVVVSVVRPHLEIRDTRGMTMVQWADAMSLQFGLLATEKIGQDWRGWASRISLPQSYVSDPIPDPYWFQDWRSWADNFNRTLSSAGY